MTKQQITPKDGCGYIIGIPSGQKLRDIPAFFLRGNWHFHDEGGEQMTRAELAGYVIHRKIEGARIEPVEFENGADYVVEFPSTGGPHGDVERMIIQYEDGVWLSLGDAVYADGPIPVDVADYRVIRKVDLWAA
jgi:hypothetical protein